jgi:hypothetical protein
MEKFEYDKNVQQRCVERKYMGSEKNRIFEFCFVLFGSIFLVGKFCVVSAAVEWPRPTLRELADGSEFDRFGNYNHFGILSSSGNMYCPPFLGSRGTTSDVAVEVV